MSDLLLPPEAVEAAVGAYRELHLDRVQWTDEQIVETIGRRLLGTMGVTVEEEINYVPRDSEGLPDDGQDAPEYVKQRRRVLTEDDFPLQYRLVSDWFPIKGPVDG